MQGGKWTLGPAHDAADYARQAQQLLPPGPAWPRDSEALLTALLEALGEEYALAEASARSLMDEADPRTTSQMLPEWEDAFGLPDECSDPGADEERRLNLVARYLGARNASRPSIEKLAGALGYSVEIVARRPFTCESACDDSLLGELDRFHWTVKTASGANDQILRCAIERLAPSHTLVTFEFN